MVAVVAPEGVDAALASLAALGVPAWVAGEVRVDDPLAADEPGAQTVRGTKGVHGGGARLVGAYR